MTVRQAAFTDIPRIAELLVEAHGRSRYEGTEVQVDVKHAKALLMSSIQRHGGKGEGATWCSVSERDGVVEGFIIGIALRVQEICEQLYVTDLIFYQSERALPADARPMLAGMIGWAGGMKKVYEITLGATDVVGDYARTGKLYERMGFEQRGAIYGMRL